MMSSEVMVDGVEDGDLLSNFVGDFVQDPVKGDYLSRRIGVFGDRGGFHPVVLFHVIYKLLDTASDGGQACSVFWVGSCSGEQVPIVPGVAADVRLLVIVAHSFKADEAETGF